MGLVAGVLLLAVSAPSSFARLNKASLCRRGGSHGRHWRRITADLAAEVFVVYESGENPEVYGCVYGKRPYRLGEVGGEDAVERFVLTGNVVAFYELDSPRDAGISGYFVKVADLRTRRKIYTVPTGKRLAPTPPGTGTGRATAIVVKPDGAVAWIAENNLEEEATGGNYYQVHELDESGARLLGSGAGIAPESLALAGGTVYWTDEGKPMSAGLE